MRKVLTSLKSILKEAMRRGLINRNCASAKKAGRHKSKVSIPAKDEIRAMLAKSAELWPLTKVEKLACPKTDDNLVFPGRSDGIVSTSNIHRQVWRPLLRELGLVDHDADGTEIPRYRFHDLRHAAASLMIEQSWQPKKVQSILGHSSIQMTYDLYGHLWETAEDDAKGMAAIEARLFS